MLISYLKKYTFSILIVLTIVYLSLFKPPKTSLSDIQNLDKLVHFCMYGGLSGVIWLEYLIAHKNKFSFKPIFLLGIIFPILLGGSMELAQKYLTSHRSGDWLDFYANTTGVIVASLIGYFVLRPLLKKFN